MGTSTGGSRNLGHRGHDDTFLITDAQESLHAQQRARVHKYLLLMSFRVPALIIAAIVYASTGSGLGALAIVAVSIPLPWVAVLIANDRPPRRRGEAPRYKYGADHYVVGPQGLERPATVVDAERTDSPGHTGPGSEHSSSRRD